MCSLSAWPYGDRFPGGQLVYKGTWYYSTYYVPNYPKGPSSGPDNVCTGGLLGPLASFRHSLDMGETWVEPLFNATSDSDNLFGETAPNDLTHDPPRAGPERVKFGTPHWVDFGQELEHSPDGKAYLVAQGATSPTSTEMWMLGDQVRKNGRFENQVPCENDRPFAKPRSGHSQGKLHTKENPV